MEIIAFTRASTIGPLMDFVEAGGGITERVFKSAELPIQLCDRPNALIPLRDQFKLVEYAARELGDDALPARLSTAIGAQGLGSYGDQFLSAPTLGDAIRNGNEIFCKTLQTGTEMRLTVANGRATWDYRVKDRAKDGRQKNEVLALGYMLDLLRQYAGANWVPHTVELAGSRPQGQLAIETILRCELARGELTSIVFSADLLAMPGPNAGAALPSAASDNGLVHLAQFRDCVAEVVRLGLLDARPQRSWAARRFEMSVRTFQRRLQDVGTSFEEIMQFVLDGEATRLLRNDELTVSEVAYELGYSDPAHFTRAFQSWHGLSPRAWRERHRKHTLSPAS